jgi:ATP-dependent protease Clp ATPase subunit
LHGIFIDYVVCLKREENYYENINIFQEMYKNEFTLVTINELTKGRIINAVKLAVYEAKKATVDTRPPAVWVIGPTLSGKTTIAKKLADYYDLSYFNLDGMDDIKVSNFIRETLISREV